MDFTSIMHPYWPLVANIGAAVVVGTGIYYASKSMGYLRGKLRMRYKIKFRKDVLEVIEDCFCDGLTEAIEAKRITLEEARQMYAKLAHLGFWGLHPRKFTPKKTAEDFAKLKQAIKERRSAKSSSEASVAKLLEGVLAELKQ